MLNDPDKKFTDSVGKYAAIFVMTALAYLTILGLIALTNWVLR